MTIVPDFDSNMDIMDSTRTINTITYLLLSLLWIS